jgi:hypothetical protein
MFGVGTSRVPTVQIGLSRGRPPDHPSTLLVMTLSSSSLDLARDDPEALEGSKGQRAAGAAIVAGSQCSSALPLTNRHVSNHVV